MTAIKLLFASDGDSEIFLMAGVGELYLAAREQGSHAEDILGWVDSQDIPKTSGLHVFTGQAYWTDGTYENPHDCDFVVEGSWRKPTTQEAWRFCNGKTVW